MKQYTKEMFEVSGPLFEESDFREDSIRDILIHYFKMMYKSSYAEALRFTDYYIEGWLKERNGK